MRGQQNRFTRGNNRSDSHNAANLAKFKVGDIVKGTVKVRNIVVIFHLRRLLRKNVTHEKTNECASICAERLQNILITYRQ